MIKLEEFREYYINNDILPVAEERPTYPVEAFAEKAIEMIENEFNLASGMTTCFLEKTDGNKKYKNMHIDAGNFDNTSGTLNLMVCDFNSDQMETITNTDIDKFCRQLIAFVENSLKGYFDNGEISDPAVQLGREVKDNYDEIAKVHLFIASTNVISDAVKTLKRPDFTYGESKYKVSLDIIDIERIYKNRLSSFEKEELLINCSDYGFDGIRCLKTSSNIEGCDIYLTEVPGEFLAKLYVEFGARLLESNVRAFLKMNTKINKGIRKTILENKEYFFAYNNGITVESNGVETKNQDGSLLITNFKNFQIVNGGQTTATLTQTMIKNRADLVGIYVQMKLIVLTKKDDELLKNIARFANKQNTVKDADFNSGHPFYVMVEDYSRKTFAPIVSGELGQKLWFFERIRGQYDLPFMTMTKSERDRYQLKNPKDKKFTLADLAKYQNCARKKPHFAAWGSDVSVTKFHAEIEKEWEVHSDRFDLNFYKEIIGQKILFDRIRILIMNTEWYQNNKAYLPQLTEYTFSKIVFEAEKKDKLIDYLKIWSQQGVSKEFESDLLIAAKMVFDAINDPNRSTTNIQTYCKKEECWKVISQIVCPDLVLGSDMLISKEDKVIETLHNKKQYAQDVTTEMDVFDKGAPFWQSFENFNLSQEELDSLSIAIDYCNMVTFELSAESLEKIRDLYHKYQ